MLLGQNGCEFFEVIVSSAQDRQGAFESVDGPARTKRRILDRRRWSNRVSVDKRRCFVRKTWWLFYLSPLGPETRRSAAQPSFLLSLESADEVDCASRWAFHQAPQAPCWPSLRLNRQAPSIALTGEQISRLISMSGAFKRHKLGNSILRGDKIELSSCGSVSFEAMEWKVK